MSQDWWQNFYDTFIPTIFPVIYVLFVLQSNFYYCIRFYLSRLIFRG